MISETITLLLYALVAMAALQPNSPRFFAAILFTGVTLIHEWVLGSYGGFEYYGSAAIFDLFIIIVVGRVRPLSGMVLGLQKICVVSIFLNLVGWLMWVLYLPPLVYDTSYAGLYLWSLIIMMKRDTDDAMGSTGVVGGFTSVWFYGLERRSGDAKNKGGA